MSTSSTLLLVRDNTILVLFWGIIISFSSEESDEIIMGDSMPFLKKKYKKPSLQMSKT